MNRKLAAIPMAGVVGYFRPMGQDAAGTVAAMVALFRDMGMDWWTTQAGS